MRARIAVAAVLILIALPALAQLTPKEQLGKSIFVDANLSLNHNQSCATCHGPDVGWTGPSEVVNKAGAVYEGSVPGAFGNRKPPASSYATQSPIFHTVVEKGETLFVGGLFWDGRATGKMLGSPAAEQALGPFLNPAEQALPTPAAVVTAVCSSTYATLFEEVWGAGICAGDVNTAYEKIGFSIASYEASAESNAFTSKYDYFLKGEAKLTPEERLGLAVFRGDGKCDNCHTLEKRKGVPPLFTDFTYDNLGLPRNPANPFYTSPFNPEGYDYVDVGLGGYLANTDYKEFADANIGKFKVPTLRNVDRRPSPEFVKAYGHNGYFKSLKGIVHYYNTRDVKPRCASKFTSEAQALTAGCWPEPEVKENMNTTELGNLHLTFIQENAIVAFLKTLSDGYRP